MRIDAGWIRAGVHYAVERIMFAFDRRITFEDNVQSFTANVISPDTADTTFEVVHSIGRTPARWLANPTSAATVWSVDKGSWNDRVIYLRCSEPSVTITLTVW